MQIPKNQVENLFENQKMEFHKNRELALLYNAPRSASVKCFEQCSLWGIDRNTFRRAVEEMITKEYEENRKKRLGDHGPKRIRYKKLVK